jgi:tRNA1Val (adenine37-N6)-methyltransferase
LTKHCTIYPKENKKANRVLIEYSTKEDTLIEEKLTIYNLDNSYTKEYLNLTQAFYLKM